MCWLFKSYNNLSNKTALPYYNGKTTVATADYIQFNVISHIYISVDIVKHFKN